MKNPIRVFIILGFMLLSGCAMNQPTPPEQLTAVYVDERQYMNYDCQTLAHQYALLEQNERQAVEEHKQHIKRSSSQEFWYGVGLGDGMASRNIRQFRGHKEAIHRVMSLKQCY